MADRSWSGEALSFDIDSELGNESIGELEILLLKQMANRSWCGQTSRFDIDSEVGNVSTGEAENERNDEVQNEDENETEHEEENANNEKERHYAKRNSEGKQHEFAFADKKPKTSLPAFSGGVGITSQTPSNIFDIQSSLMSASLALEYYEASDDRFHHLQAGFARAKAETQQLTEQNKKIADDLLKTKEEAESYKQNFEEKFNQSEELQTRSAALERDLECAKEDNKRIYKEKEKMGHELEYARKRVEYYKRIDHVKDALKILAEFEGLNQVLHPINHSDHESSKGQTDISTKRKYVLKIHEIDDSLSCPICFEQWSASGEHNMCSLGCGHFFGRSCITNWINRTRNGSSKCPQCLRGASLKDIRNHYPPQAFVGGEKI